MAIINVVSLCCPSCHQSSGCWLLLPASPCWYTEEYGFSIRPNCRSRSGGNLLSFFSLPPQASKASKCHGIWARIMKISWIQKKSYFITPLIAMCHLKSLSTISHEMCFFLICRGIFICLFLFLYLFKLLLFKSLLKRKRLKFIQWHTFVIFKQFILSLTCWHKIKSHYYGFKN